MDIKMSKLNIYVQNYGWISGWVVRQLVVPGPLKSWTLEKWLDDVAINNNQACCTLADARSG